MYMKAEIKYFVPAAEFSTAERCFITEVANDLNDDVSITRARVEPGVTTAWHKLRNTAERYIIVSGRGRMEVRGVPPSDVAAGDVVRIPPDTPQRIINTGGEDLVFFAVCSPRFTQDCYTSE